MNNIRTDRLILRQWTPDDFAPFAKLNGDPLVREYFPSTLTREESDRQATLFSQDIEKNGYGLWAVSAPGVSDFIGFIGIKRVEMDAPFVPAVEIGWRLAHEYWGKGYATEGARAALQFGFETLELPEIVSFTPVGNRRSRAVMEKIGMIHEPSLDFDHPGVPEGNRLKRHVLYKITCSQWQNTLT